MEKQLIIEQYFKEHPSSNITKETLIGLFEKQLKAEKLDTVPYYVAETFFRRVLSQKDDDRRKVKISKCF